MARQLDSSLPQLPELDQYMWCREVFRGMQVICRSADIFWGSVNQPSWPVCWLGLGYCSHQPWALHFDAIRGSEAGALMQWILSLYGTPMVVWQWSFWRALLHWQNAWCELCALLQKVAKRVSLWLRRYQGQFRETCGRNSDGCCYGISGALRVISSVTLWNPLNLPITPIWRKVSRKWNCPCTSSSGCRALMNYVVASAQNCLESSWNSPRWGRMIAEGCYDMRMHKVMSYTIFFITGFSLPSMPMMLSSFTKHNVVFFTVPKILRSKCWSL